MASGNNCSEQSYPEKMNDLSTSYMKIYFSPRFSKLCNVGEDLLIATDNIRLTSFVTQLNNFGIGFLSDSMYDFFFSNKGCVKKPKTFSHIRNRTT